MKVNPIIIPKPCHENWHTMTPNEQGRHCNTCAKTVVDVSNLTNDVIWEKHAQNNNSLCIRIPTHRVAKLSRTRFHQLKIALIATIVGFWLTVKETVYAQADSTSNNKNKIPIDTNQAIQKIIINGTVSDSIDRLNVLAFCNISVLQNNEVIGGGYSNSDGKFTISILGNFNAKDKFTLKCVSVGFKNAQIEFTPKDSIQCDIYMNENHICLNEAVITMRRDTYMVGKLQITKGIMIDMRDGKSRKKILDQYDTKTYYSDEIERYNLGR